MSNPASGLLIAKNNDAEIDLLPRMANRHGLVTGATGTGKTVTLQTMAESLSRAGVPVFVADIKGDFAGISQPGTPKPRITERIQQLNLGEYQWESAPVTFWDVFGEQGHPVRATVSDLGPLLFSRLLALNDTQSGVLSIIFKIADDQGLLLLDLKDLRAMAQYVGDNAKEFKTAYGNVTAASIGAIQRQLLTLEEQNAAKFFGEPALDLDDMLQTVGGKGVVNVLAADRLVLNPKTYATMLLWLLSELFERLPEAGDLDKPKLVFFFDEAHLLFEDAPDALVAKIEQVVRLIRSKGVGVYFVTQNPLDVPVKVLGQLGNRVQHALRAFTPLDQKAVKTAADTFRPNPKFDTGQVITELGVGEALVSFLDDKGIPGVVERAFVVPPHSQIGAITPEQRRAIMDQSLVKGVYDTAVDNESAYEKLKMKVDERQAAALAAQKTADEAQAAADAAKNEQKAREKAQKEADRAAQAAQRQKERDDAAAQRERERQDRADERERARTELQKQREEERQRKQREAMLGGLLGSVGRTAANSIVRGVLGGMVGGTSRRR